MKTSGALVALALVLAAGSARALAETSEMAAEPTPIAPAPPTPVAGEPPSSPPVPPSCSASSDARSPDSRCGESLDGRPPEPTSGGRAVARAVLWVPRGLSRALFWPVVATTEAVEHHHVLDWIHSAMTSDDELVGATLLLEYATGFTPSVGVRLFYRRLPGPGSEIATRLETAGPAVLLGELDLSGPAWLGLNARAMWNRRNDGLFAGIGPLSEADLAAASQGQARYGSDVALAELRWSRHVGLQLFPSLHADLQRRDYQASSVNGGPSVATEFGLPPGTCTAPPLSNECVDPQQMPGFQEGMRIVHAGGGLIWDGRSHTRHGGGGSIAIDASFGKGIAGDNSLHVTYSFETILVMGGLDRTFLLRGRAATVRALGTTPVPFEELIAPAGNGGMRGFPEGRFHGRSGVVGTAEYRWYVAHNLDGTLFSDVGTVGGANFSGLAKWFPTFGVGLRLSQNQSHYWEGASTGIQVAYAPDNGFRIMLALAPF